MEVPSELAALDQWVNWKLTERRGKVTKVPHRPSDGMLASTTKRSDWGTLEEALEGLEAHGMDGIGFVFSKDDPYCGLDFDHCIEDEAIHPAVMNLLDEFDSYTELSPSGTGVHVIIKAKPGQGRRTQDTEWGGNFEIYDQGRYFTFTGLALRGMEIRDVTWEISVATENDKDLQLINRCRRNVSGFVALFDEGDISDYDNDHSRADLALANMLAARTQDPDQIERIMLQSALKRDKWEHPDTGSTWVRRRCIEPALRDSQTKKGRQGFTGDFESDVAHQMYMMQVRDEAKIRIAQEQALVKEFPYPLKQWSLADELALPPREHVWRVQDLQRVHGNVVLIAGYKLGKTTLIMNLVRSLVDGTPFLDLFPVDRFEGNVAVFNYELDPEQWVDWARDMKIEYPEKIKPFHLRGLGTLQFWLPSVQDRLVDWMIENEIRYWVLDPTAQAWDTLLESEGDNIRAAQFTRAIDTVKQRAGIDEANLTHHTSRTNQEAGRGPSALEGWYDAGWFLTGKRDALQFHAIGRDVDISPTNIAFHEDKARSFLLDTRAEKEEVREKKEAKRVALEILRELGPLSQSAMGKEMKARDVGVSNNKLKSLLEHWCKSMDNPMAFREELINNRRTRTYYLKEHE